jgi:serine/threonine protein kinase
VSRYGSSFTADLTAIYNEGFGTERFAEVLEHIEVEGDDDLADLIEADGRLRIRLNLPLSLDRYLEAVPDLRRRPDPLDAAIDMVLRSMARDVRAGEEPAEALIKLHPDLAPSIREASALSAAIWSTSHIRQQLSEATTKQLPCPFGPLLDDGEHRYELAELLGEGAFGQVYLAIDRQLSDPDHPARVSIKVLPAGRRSAWSRQRLIDEATKARRIEHPNVVSVFDRGVSDEDEDFVVYEYVPGGDLSQRYRRTRGDGNIRDAVRLMAKIARGVHAAHMAGLVHCDLKPNNIILTNDGEPKVSDFGIAVRAHDENGSSAQRVAAQQKEPMGNLAFMSPEQFHNDLSGATIPSDIYALGGILYWLVTGQLPNGDTPEQIERTHDPETGRNEPPSMRGMRRGVDRTLDAVCRRAMARQPAERYDSAAALADDLESWLALRPIAWQRPSVVRRIGLWTRRKPTLAASLVALVLVVVVSGIVTREALAEAAVRKRINDNVKARLQIAAKEYANASNAGVFEEFLAVVWMLEWMLGPEVFDTPQHASTLWRVRIDALHQLVERAEDNGHAFDVRTVIWETCLGLWLVLDGDHERANAVTWNVLQKWKMLLEPTNPGDPWLDHAAALHACAAFDSFLAMRDDGPIRDDEIDRARAWAEAMQRSDARLQQLDNNSPLAELLIERLAWIYGPDMLDDPRKLEDLRSRWTDDYM